MSSAYVRTKVRSRLEGAGLGLPLVSDVWLVTDDDPPGGAEYWIAPDFPGAIEEQITVGAPGNNTFRESGTFQVHVFALAGLGDATLTAHAETIRTLFRAQTIDSIRYYGADPPLIGEGRDDGLWMRATVAVEYEYDLYA